MSEELPFQALAYSENKEIIEQPRNDLRNSKGGTMQFDFSHFYQEKTVDIKNGETVIFQVVVTEIATGDSAQIQNEAFSHVDMEKVTAKTKKGRQKQIQKQINAAMKEMNGGESAVRETLCGVKSWTLTDASGKPVPVDYAVFMKLPKSITKQIETAVEELNPEEDEEFPDDDGDER
jgi:hypothetical protein